jgi:hypothetical protein
MRDGNNEIGTCFTFAVVVRGELEEINRLIDFLKASDLKIAHQKISEEKLWIKKDGDY